jgi:hypothetical protein
MMYNTLSARSMSRGGWLCERSPVMMSTDPPRWPSLQVVPHFLVPPLGATWMQGHRNPLNKNSHLCTVHRITSSQSFPISYERSINVC